MVLNGGRLKHPRHLFWLLALSLLSMTLFINPALAGAKPAAFNLMNPNTGATVSSNLPTLSWQASSNANRYRLQIRNANGKKVKNVRYNAVDIGCGSGTCSVVSPYSFRPGTYSWRVQAQGSSGKYTTAYVSFTVSYPYSVSQQVLDLVNEKRCKAGLVPLALNPSLTNAAQAHSNRMMQMNFFSHDDPYNGTSPWDRIASAGYTGTTLAENIAAGQTTAEVVFNTWWRSSGHKRNMMNRNFREMGLGFAQGGSYGYYWTQTFGTRSGATGGTCP